MLLCARPNVQEFLCPVSEIAKLIEGRVNMNSAVEQTSLNSTRRAIERALWPLHHRRLLAMRSPGLFHLVNPACFPLMHHEQGE